MAAKQNVTDQYREHLTKVGKSLHTVRAYSHDLAAFARWAKQEGLVGDNPLEVLEQVLLKEQKDTAPRWLDCKEQLALLRAVRQAAGEL
jgi:site-specific recombinase XerD